MSSEEDIQSAASFLIPQSLSSTRVNGRIDQAKAFTELREIALVVLALDPNAILRLIAIVRDKVQAAASSEFDLASQLKDALDALDLNPAVTPFRTTEQLEDASAALTDLQSNIGAGFVDPGSLARTNVSLDAFLDSQVAPNVKSGGSALVTKEEAIRQSRELLPQLVSAHQETLRRLFQLEITFQEFAAADLRVLVGNSIVEKSKVLVDRIQQSASFSPTDSAARSTKHLADIVTIKRLLASYFSAPGVLDPRFVGDISNSFRAQPVGAGNPAQLISTTAVRPLVLIESGSSIFDVTANGIPTSTDLVAEGIESRPAILFGAVAGPYNIMLGVNDTFTLSLDQAAPTVVTLTVGAVVPLATIISDINTAVGSTVAFSDTFMGMTVLRLQSTTNGRNSNVFIGSGNANATIGFTAGSLASGSDPTLTGVIGALNSAQVEYVAEVIDASPAQTTLVSSSTGVISNGLLTDGSVPNFLTAGVEGGDSVIITSGTNKDVTVPVSRVVAAQVHLAGVRDDTATSYTIVRDNRQLQLTSADSSPSSSLDVDSGDANAVLGFSGTESAIGTVDFVLIEQQTPAPAVPVDVTLFSVVVGDELTLELGPAQIFTITGFDQLLGDPVIRIDPPAPNDFVSAEFSIKSFGAESLIALIDDPVDPAKPLPNFIHNTLTEHGYDVDLRVLEDAVAQAINEPSLAAAATALADDLKSVLDSVSGLQFILAAYSAAEVDSLQRLIDALEEHGFDRFLTLLTEGFVEEALATTKDNFSFSAQLQTAAGEVNMEDLGV